jgi:uncharacterized membrane protein
MFWKKHKVSDEKLDSIGKELLKAATLNDQEVDQIANAPFSYARLRANIMQESIKHSEASDNWFAIVSLARYAIPVMLVIALITISSFWLLHQHTEQVSKSNANLLLPAMVSAPITACSISSKSECVVSNNDVLSIVFQEQTLEIKNESAK